MKTFLLDNLNRRLLLVPEALKINDLIAANANNGLSLAVLADELEPFEESINWIIYRQKYKLPYFYFFR